MVRNRQRKVVGAVNWTRLLAAFAAFALSGGSV
jgi:hypothetical protein